MRPIPDTPVFTREAARAAGWSDSALTRAVQRGDLQSPRRGLFMRAGVIDERVAAMAAAAAVAGSVVSHRSALLLHGLPLVGPKPPQPEITVRPDGRGAAHAAHLHRATVPSDDVMTIGATPVTTPARTVIDVARRSPDATAVAAIDAALFRKMASPSNLNEVVRRCWNWPGIGRALRALRQSDGRAESALESVSRLTIVRLGLPLPDLQPVILDQRGYPAGRLDFYWDEFGVAGEADGRLKYTDRDVLASEKDRQELMEDHALVFVRWGWSQATRDTMLLKARLLSGFDRGRRRDRSGFPRLWSVRRTKPVT